jgi:hypothetical protein
MIFLSSRRTSTPFTNNIFRLAVFAQMYTAMFAATHQANGSRSNWSRTAGLRNFALERLLTKSVPIRMDDMAPIGGRGKIWIIAGGSCTVVEEGKHILHHARRRFKCALAFHGRRARYPEQERRDIRRCYVFQLYLLDVSSTSLEKAAQVSRRSEY